MSNERMATVYGTPGLEAAREWWAQEYLWNRSGIGSGGGADRAPALWVEINGGKRLQYDPDLDPAGTAGDAPYESGKTYSAGDTVTHLDPDTDGLVRWSYRGPEGLVAPDEFNKAHWHIDYTGSRPEPFLMMAAGVAHYEARYREFEPAVNHRSWSVWHHGRIPWDPEFDPFEYRQPVVINGETRVAGGYPLWATDELPQTDNANIYVSPFAFDQIRMKARSKTAYGFLTAVPVWV